MKGPMKITRFPFSRWSNRIKLVFIFLVTLMFLFYVNLWKTNKDILELRFYKENVKFLDTLNATECKLPQYDIYDPEIKRYIEKPPTPIVCGYVQPYLTYLDWDGLLYLNKTEIDYNRYTDLKCTYQAVVINPANDYKVNYGTKVPIKFPMKVKEPVIKVACNNGGFHLYSMIHAQIRPLSEQKIIANKAIPKHRPSLLIFVIDSMSRGNFIRTLSKTYDFLVNKLNMTVFKGLNKVADNTYPNMMALLAGLMEHKRDNLKVPTWSVKVNSTTGRYDDMPIIWKTLQEAGYTTMYCEEYMGAIFSYLDVGFHNDPVDYYYRPTYVALQDTLANLNMNKLKFWDRSKWRYCLGNEPSYKYMLNFTEEFLTEMAHLRYFSLSFFVEMSHEYLTDIANMDDDLFKFFTKMFESGKFDNTVVLVMGDHGHRFDGIRSTFIGRIEERMPFLGIKLPEVMQKRYPHLQQGLNSHTENLLSWFDIHETLVDIVEDDLGVKARKVRPNAVGKSIFRPFHENRTCSQIGILSEYCMCDRESKIPSDSEKAIISAEVAIEHINKLLEDAHQYINDGDSRKCASLKLNQVTSATMAMRSFSSGRITLLIRVMFRALPSEGMFEAAVEHSPATNPVIIGDINRINKYGNQPSCIFHNILRLYCYCV